MSTSLRDLLDQARHETEQAAPAADDAQTAITALAHANRALTLLSTDGITNLVGSTSRQIVIASLAAACEDAAKAWPPSPGPLSDLFAVAADVAARAAQDWSTAQRWAAAVAIGDTARRCSHAARRFAPYTSTPQLTGVSYAAAMLERLAATDPPTTHGRVVLDLTVPVTALPNSWSSVRVAAESTAALIAALRRAVSGPGLALGDALAAAAAAELAATHAAALADALSPHPTAVRSWRHTAAAWRTVRVTCAPFDDGTKARPAAESSAGMWATRLHRALRSEFGPAGPLSASALRQRRDLPEIATLMRAVANQLPEIAHQIGLATLLWAETKQLLARERSLTSYEDRNLAVTTNNIVAVGHSDLAEVRTSLRGAERLSAALATQLDRSAHDVGRQPQPDLAAAHAATLTGPRVTETLHRQALTAAQRSSAPAPTQWTFGNANAPRRSGPRR